MTHLDGDADQQDGDRLERVERGVRDPRRVGAAEGVALRLLRLDDLAGGRHAACASRALRALHPLQALRLPRALHPPRAFDALRVFDGLLPGRRTSCRLR